MTVAVYLPQYRDELPIIEKVVSFDSENAEVEWYVGSYSGVWKVCKRRQGRELVPWRETIPQECILFPVNFTKSFRLRKCTVDQLKEAYKNSVVQLVI